MPDTANQMRLIRPTVAEIVPTNTHTHLHTYTHRHVGENTHIHTQLSAAQEKVTGSEVTQLLSSVRRASSEQRLSFCKRRHTDQLPGTECVCLTGSGFFSSSQTGSRTSRQVFHPATVATPPASMLEGLKHSSSKHKSLQSSGGSQPPPA